MALTVRQGQIIDYLTQKKHAKISEISKHIAASDATVRRENAEFAKREKVGAMLGIAEVVGRRAIHRHRAGVRRRVARRVLASMDRQRFEMVFFLAHFRFSFPGF